MKRHKKAIAVLLAVILITIAPVKARAIVPEVTAFFAAGVGWPLVATVLIAGGIGTALYWNSLDDIEKSQIVHRVRTELNARGLTLYDQFNNIYLTDNYKNYVKMAYANDGKTYMSKGVVNTIYDVANDMGFTGGVHYGEITEYSHYTSDGLVRLSPRMPTSMMTTYFDCGVYSVGLSALLALYREDSIVTVNGGSGLTVHIYTTENIGDARWDYTGSPSFDKPVLHHRYTVYSDGTYKFEYNSSVYNTFVSPASFGVAKGTSIINSTNIGYYDYSIEGIPEGELGQITENNGEMEYPWLPELQNTIEGLGDSLTMTIEGVIGDIKSWEGELTDASDLLLDDVPVDESQVITGGQALAQAGSIAGGLFGAMDWETDININGIPNFRLPNWIANKFPFSVFRDLRDTIDNFKMQVGDEAPVYHYTVNITGYPIEMTIDMNMFNDYAHYVKVYLFIIGITQIMLKTIEWFL